MQHLFLLTCKCIRYVPSSGLKELASIGTVKYRPGSRYGENLFVATNFQPTAEEVVKGWYSEIFAYNYKQPGFHTNTGNFTQLIWKKSMEIGVGISKQLVLLTSSSSSSSTIPFPTVCRVGS